MSQEIIDLKEIEPLTKKSKKKKKSHGPRDPQKNLAYEARLNEIMSQLAKEKKSRKNLASRETMLTI